MTRSTPLAAALAVSLLVALFLVGSAHGAMAQTNCTSGSIKAANDCFNKQLDQANADMQAKYQTDQAAVKDQSSFVTMLAKSQDAWLAYRSQTCDSLVQTYFQEGTMQGIAVTVCKLNLTKERSSDLANMFQGLWGVQQ
jgi:uncharacterized protein YecT (DUF1311 family)